MRLAKRGPSRGPVLCDRLRDARGRRVMLVSHCLLNQNTRYAGGASRPGTVAEVVDALLREGYGMFIGALDHQLARRRLALPAFEHDLVTELQGGTQAVLEAPTARTLGSASM